MATPASRRLIILYHAVCWIGLLLATPVVAQTFFTEVTDQIEGAPFSSEGVAWGDYDNDGWPDLLLAEGMGRGRTTLWGNEEAVRFVGRPLSSGKNFKGSGVLFGDFDNDGDLDLFVPVGDLRGGGSGVNLLLRNDRGVFTDVTREAGLTDSLPTFNAIWLDYDRDGHIDLYTGNASPGDPTLRNRLYRNRGNGTFADVTDETGLNLALHPEFGGSYGGMAAGDFDGDGWPDLYVGVYEGRNRLFLNDGLGGFSDATTSEIEDVGPAWGVAVGDIDNDGDLDIFQANIMHGADRYRHQLLLNLEGRFLDVVDSVGLAALFAEDLWGVSLGDVDNDGDLDLLIGWPSYLFLNDGEGIFTDASLQYGVAGVGNFPVLGDYNLDGFLDLLFGSNGPTGARFGELYRNNGNDHHWLRVELVGAQSNRNGIGARVMTTSGDLRQMREMLGGLGFPQHEMVAHFGLGERTQVDELEIRWPSGQVDVLREIPADRKIRVFEGRQAYHVVRPTVWESLSDSLVAGSTVDFQVAVRPALFEPDAGIVRVTADLRELGGPESVELVDAGDGAYRLEDIPLALPSGRRSISVMIDQATSLGPYWTRLAKTGIIAVLPAEDRVVFDEGEPGEWLMEANRSVETADLSETGVIHRGSVSGSFQVEKSFAGWSVTFHSAVPVEPFGYTLRFAIRPGEIEWPSSARLTVGLNPGKGVSLLEGEWLDMTQQAWQVVEIPVDAFDREGPIETMVLSGNFGGTFYLDDICLVAAEPPASITAVTEDHTYSLPQSFTLNQNFPNPFNSSTAIRFSLPSATDVDLAIFNLAGQQVSTLVSGERQAGSCTIRWDGRDDDGRELASGVYLYRLQTGDGQQVETRKLVLVR